jgi:hypothetical protein
MSLRDERSGDRRDIATAIQYGDLHGPRKRAPERTPGAMWSGAPGIVR